MLPRWVGSFSKYSESSVSPGNWREEGEPASMASAPFASFSLLLVCGDTDGSEYLENDPTQRGGIVEDNSSSSSDDGQRNFFFLPCPVAAGSVSPTPLLERDRLFTRERSTSHLMEYG